MRVTGPPEARLEIDGYPTDLPWRGEYFDGMTIDVVAPPGAVLSIDGERHRSEAGPLTLDLDADREIALLSPTTAS